jgi:hypothetical protein
MKKFLEILLLPVARFCVRHGILLPEVADAMKRAMLEAGMESIASIDTQVTASRLSVMTGAHRKDTSSFLKGAAPQRDTISPAIKVLGCWHTKSRYLQPNGKPRPLSIGSEDSEFSKLVRSVSGDVHPHTILCELQRLDLVKVENDQATALKAGFVSAMDDEDTARLISRDIDELMLTAEGNVYSKGPRPHHHTTTSFDNIPLEYESELRAWLNREAGLFHKRIRDHVSQYDRDLTERSLDDSGRGTVRLSFGSFGRVCMMESAQDEQE